MHGDHGNAPLRTTQDCGTAEGTCRSDHGTDLAWEEQTGILPGPRGGSGHQIRRATETDKHTSQEGVTQLFAGCTGINTGVHRQRAEGRCMGTGEAELLGHQVTDHGLGTGQCIHASTAAVSREGRAVRIIRKTRHNRNGCGTSALQSRRGPQECIRPPEPSPTRPTGPALQRDLQGHIGPHDWPDLKTKAGSTGIGHLQVAQLQIVLNRRIQQQTHPLPSHGPEGEFGGSKPIEGRSLHIEDAAIRPVERCPVHHIGMGDQAASGSGQQPCRRQGIPCITAKLTADPGGDDQDAGENLLLQLGAAHGRSDLVISIASMTRRSSETAVIAQRNGLPWGARAASMAATSEPNGRWSSICKGTICRH